MRIYTTCGGCGELILYLRRYGNVHALCDDPLEYEARLERDFLAAATRGDDALADELAARLDSLDDNGPPRLPEAAVAYARWGWPVFPLKPGEKVPFEHSHGFKDATADVRKIQEWWRRCPTANIGLPTGLAFDVLDVDFRHGALAVWPDLRDSPDMPAAHGISLTAHYGLHVLLLPAGLGNHTKMAGHPGLDYRGRGGYIVAPPSVLADGKNYTWQVKPSALITGTASREPQP